MNPLKTKLATELLELRYWQHTINEKLKNREFDVPVHLAFGYEALAVSVINATNNSQDKMVLTHRNIQYNLALEGSPVRVVAEYEQRRSGLASGKLGSMNLTNPDKGIIYSSSILGKNLSVACGIAMSNKILNTQ